MIAKCNRMQQDSNIAIQNNSDFHRSTMSHFFLKMCIAYGFYRTIIIIRIITLVNGHHICWLISNPTESEWWEIASVREIQKLTCNTYER